MRYLFERLGRDAGAARDDFDLRAAVALQVQHLVTTLPPGRDADGEPDVLAFGMPNVVDVAPESSIELSRYARRLERLIAHYEPRLARARVEAERSAGRPRIVVSGVLRDGDGTQHAVRFPVDAHSLDAYSGDEP